MSKQPKWKLSKQLKRSHKSVKCPNCGEAGPHLVPPSFGDKGLFGCEKKLVDPETGVEKPIEYYGLPADAGQRRM